MSIQRFIVEEVTDADEIARHRAQTNRIRRNSEWLQSHWSDLVPLVRGRFVAVAGQEAFVADTPESARSLARAAHPDDDGLIAQYVRPEGGPRIYAHPR